MKDLIKFTDELLNIKTQLSKPNQEWPFPGYKKQVENLVNYFGKELFFCGECSDRNTITDILQINEKYIHPQDQNALHPYSIMFRDGSAVNTNIITWVGIENKIREFKFYVDPFFFAIVPTTKKLEFLKSDGIVYLNPYKFVNDVYASKKTQDDISKMTKKTF